MVPSTRGLGTCIRRFVSSAGTRPAAPHYRFACTGREFVSEVIDPTVASGPKLNLATCTATQVRRVAALPVLLLGTFALAGCGMSSLTSGLGNSVFGGSSSAAKGDVKTVSEDQLLSAAKSGDGAAPAAISADAGGCPRFVVGQRDNNLTIYESGRVGDGLAILHRGEITKTGRECLIDGGKVTIRYGFAGRVLLGPKGKTGNIKLPVNITITDAKREKIAGDSIKVDVDIAVDKPIGYFSAVKSITIPIPEGSRPGEFEILVGFDRAVPGAG